MDDIVKVKTVADFDRIWGVETRHPLVNVIEGSRIPTPVAHCRKHFDLYVIYIKDIICADRLTYGRGEYDFTFFSYAINEALHISPQERRTITDCLCKIDEEIAAGADSHSNMIIASAIELFLNYCARFYDRQFITRKKVNKDIITSFEELVDDYYSSGKAAQLGTLTVNCCADRLNLSPNYFGDLIRKETGVSPKEYIQSRSIAAAKEMLWQTRMSVSEIAYALGYQYPQYFTRAFKNATGLPPNEYRRINSAT